MFLNQPRQSLYQPQYAPNQDTVLQQFYEQRKKRSRNSVKRHSLLQKNSSYFSNSNYANISQNLTQNSENNQEAVSSHYSSFNNMANINVHPHASLPGSAKNRSYNLPNQTNAHVETKTVMDARNQIKQRSTSITQAEILRKYQDVNYGMSKTMNSHSMGTTAPVTPSTNSTRVNNILMESNRKNVNNNQNTPLCMKSNNQNNLTASNTNKSHPSVEETKQNTQTKYRNTERRKNLQKLQNNFKILTGQLPAYQGEFYDNAGKIKSQVMKNNTKSIQNEKKNLNIDISHQNKLNEINPKSSLSTTPKNSRVGIDCISGTENITIINKIRSNKKCEPSASNPNHSNQSTTIKVTKIPPRTESIPQSNLINIKEYLANNSSFCANEQTEDKCSEYGSNNHKHDEDQPLLVLANAKHISKDENKNENTLTQIYEKYNININKNSNNKMRDSGVMKKVITNQQSNQQYSQYQDRHDQILIEQEGEVNNPIPSEQCWQEFQSPNFKMYVDNTEKNKINKHANRINTNQSVYPPNKQQQSKQINSKKNQLLKNYDCLGNTSNKCNLNNSRASKGSISSKTNKKFTNNQTKITLQTQQKMKQKNSSIQPDKQNRFSKQSLNELHQAEIQKLQARILELEKSNKKQKKFIDSVHSMRRTIQKVDDDCNLKDLWRWLKVLPSKI